MNKGYVPLVKIESYNHFKDPCNFKIDSHFYLRNKVFLGGGKIWECTMDLGNFLAERLNDKTTLLETFKNKIILDLGCGAGVLGILALNAGAQVHFHDYVTE